MARVARRVRRGIRAVGGLYLKGGEKGKGGAVAYDQKKKNSQRLKDIAGKTEEMRERQGRGTRAPLDDVEKEGYEEKGKERGGARITKSKNFQKGIRSGRKGTLLTSFISREKT